MHRKWFPKLFQARGVQCYLNSKPTSECSKRCSPTLRIVELMDVSNAILWYFRKAVESYLFQPFLMLCWGRLPVFRLSEYRILLKLTSSRGPNFAIYNGQWMNSNYIKSKSTPFHWPFCQHNNWELIVLTVSVPPRIRFQIIMPEKCLE